MIIGGNGMPKIEIHQTAIIGHALRPLQGMICSKENPMDPKVIIEGDLYIGPISISPATNDSKPIKQSS